MSGPSLAIKARPYLFLLPSLAMVLVFAYYPFVMALYWSLFDWDGATHARFVGLGNFKSLLFEDKTFHRAMAVVAALLLANLVKVLTLPMLAARLTFGVRRDRVRFVVQTAFVVPMVIPAVVNVLLWRFMYGPDGLINRAMSLIGIDSPTHGWLVDHPLSAIIFMGFPWISATAAFLLYLAGMLNIPGDVLDAARADGATGVRRFWHVELPLLRGQLRLVVVLMTLETLQSFYTILLLTRGGPGELSMVPGLHMYYRAFSYSEYGYASAIGVILFAIMMTLTLLNMRYMRGATECEAK